MDDKLQNPKFGQPSSPTSSGKKLIFHHFSPVKSRAGEKLPAPGNEKDFHIKPSLSRSTRKSMTVLMNHSNFQAGLMTEKIKKWKKEYQVKKGSESPSYSKEYSQMVENERIDFANEKQCAVKAN